MNNQFPNRMGSVSDHMARPENRMGQQKRSFDFSDPDAAMVLHRRSNAPTPDSNMTSSEIDAYFQSCQPAWLEQFNADSEEGEGLRMQFTSPSAFCAIMAGKLRRVYR